MQPLLVYFFPFVSDKREITKMSESKIRLLIVAVSSEESNTKIMSLLHESTVPYNHGTPCSWEDLFVQATCQLKLAKKSATVPK